MPVRRCLAALLASALAVAALPSAAEPLPASDIPADFKPSDALKDFTIREVQIPMRDGVKLHVNLVIPKGARNAPIIFSRTPYSADKAITGLASNRYALALPVTYAELAAAGYIIAVQDVRGRYRSEGDYIVTRPLAGPLNPTDVDHSTDTWDSIDWLVKNVPETNGKVGTIGVSYGGFTTLMSLVNPHPALGAAVPINPLVDGWVGDDWFHNGAYRQSFLDWVYRMTADKSSKHALQFDHYDTYESWLGAGSASDMAKVLGIADFPVFRKAAAHPAYDEYWQQQALDRILAKEPLKVPTLHVHSLWDQEDIYGAPAVYKAMEPKDAGNSRNYMIIGPWQHGQSNVQNGAKLGAIDFGSNTSAWYRSEVLIPFFDAHLKDGAPKADLAPVTAFETGANVWHRYDRWPISCASDCPSQSKPIYLQPDGGLGWSAPAARAAFAEYVSDPARPVTYRERPILSTYNPNTTWGRWLVDDQRFAEARPDVVTFVSEVLTEDVRLAGQPIAKVFASTSGTDSDWVVKLIDVYPAEYPAAPEMGGYELAISMDILRGRYRDDPSKPTAIPANKVVPYEIRLPDVSHRFLKGHRIMVQIQSSWFPLYDRNPQTFVPNIFFAKKEDYRKATQRIYTSSQYPSRIELPVVE
ncbi:CocE/NonD family hydrolase [Sphingosinicella microcystinivorans]|uniref:CocE/NonD family hydrolase n=1 Tax=Sphingosinicella microcystinivorans TaxID=335406 RepID=UPI0022F3977D|nr:CocE/NonD family hydrolase [Sphingosinicella microcystinivorans]WBX83242.1 CocE/NonD family hydrolase [Sphingosinicella microcystinivorans]